MYIILKYYKNVSSPFRIYLQPGVSSGIKMETLSPILLTPVTWSMSTREVIGSNERRDLSNLEIVRKITFWKILNLTKQNKAFTFGDQVCT